METVDEDLNVDDIVVNEWIIYEFDQESWTELGRGARAEVRRRKEEEETSEKKTEEREVGTKGTRAEALAALIGQMVGSVELALSLLERLNSTDKLKSFSTYVTNFSDRGIDFKGINKETVKELYNLDHSALMKRVDTDRIRYVPFTIHNYGEILSRHPAIKVVNEDAKKAHYRVGEQDFFVSLNNNALGFLEACTVLQSVVGLEKKIEYRVREYNQFMEMLTRILVLHYDVDREGSGIKMKRKTAMGVPDGLDDKSYKSTIAVIKAFEAFMKGAEDNIIPVVAKDNATMLPIVYSAIYENKWLENKPLSNALKILLMQKKDLAVVYEVPDSVLNEWISKGKAGHIDNTFADLKKALEDARAWREKSKVTDTESHDWMMDGDYIHLPSAKWGVAHMIKLLLDCMENEPEKSIECIEMFGSRAADTARAMELVPTGAEGKSLFKALKPDARKALTAKGLVVSVDKWTCTQAKEGTTTNPTMTTCAGKYLMVVSDFIEEKTDVEVQVQTILGSFRKPENHINRFKLVVSTNMMAFGKFEKILEICHSFKVGLDFWKHPRLHNDHIYLVIDSDKRLNQDIVKKWFTCLWVARENNAIRNAGIYTGVKPKRKDWEGDTNMIHGIYAAMRLTDVGKSAKFRVDRTSFRGAKIAYALVMGQGSGLDEEPEGRPPEEFGQTGASGKEEEQGRPPDKGGNNNNSENVKMAETAIRGREEDKGAPGNKKARTRSQSKGT